MQNRPQARTEGVLAEWVEDDLVLYDQATHSAHSLSAAAASVWQVCDGQRSPDEIADQLGLESAMVARALHELSDCGLLEGVPVVELGYSRREAAARIAKVGGAVLAAPLIYSVAVPTAAAAVSCQANGSTVACGAGVGSTGAQALCCSGICYNSSGTKTCVPAGCGPTGATCTVGGDCCSGSCGVKTAGKCDT